LSFLPSWSVTATSGICIAPTSVAAAAAPPAFDALTLAEGSRFVNFIPHFGHFPPGVFEVTSGCIGQAYSCDAEAAVEDFATGVFRAVLRGVRRCAEASGAT
jgi:hypothetical protein